ncbi:MAG: Cobalamin-binding protein [Bacteroidetes bacterium]|nr:Cobalamin-binding protein [Bacteroidota bacterium]
MTTIFKSGSLRFARFVSALHAGRLSLVLLLAALSWSSCTQRERHNSQPLVSLTDDLGHVVALQHVPRRIISLAPSITETLYALGLDSSLVGVTDYCDEPPAAKRKAKIGGILNPNIERILALQPDLVLMSGSGNMRSDYDKLTSSGISAFVSHPRSIDGILKSITDVGILTSREPIADSLVRLLLQRRDTLVRQAATHQKKTVLMLLSLNPIVAIGPGTFLDELITLANGRNIAHNSTTAYPLLSREEILRRQPDVIIATNDIVRSTDDLFSPYPEWKSLTAVQNKRVAIVDASIVSRPGPRIIDGLDAVVRAIHFSR